jgi:hypothetical protein
MKRTLTKFKVFIVSKLFKETVSHLAQAGWEQLPESWPTSLTCFVGTSSRDNTGL